MAAKQVPGTLDFRVANDNAYTASTAAMSDTERLAKIALAVQQIAGGLRVALQAIYDEVR